MSLDVIASIQKLTAGFSGTIGVCAKRLRPLDPDGDFDVRYRDEVTFPAASTIKLPILIDLFGRIDAGDVDPTETIALQAGDAVTGSGVLKDLQPGLELTILDLATLMITVSDNTATNLLIERLGLESINRWITSVGLNKTYLAGKLQVPGAEETAEQRRGRLSSSSPRDLLRAIIGMYQDTWASVKSSHTMLDILRRQQYTGIVGRYLNYDIDAVEDGQDSLIIGSKGGAIRGVRNEVAIVWGRDVVYAFAIMSKDCADRRFYVDNEAEVRIALLSQILFDHFRSHGD